MNSGQELQVSDTTKPNSSNTAKYINQFIHTSALLSISANSSLRLE